MQAGNACCEGLLVGCSWGSVIRVTGRLHPRSPSVRRTRFPEDRPPSKIRPGRVVTLLPASDPEAQVWGVAYEIAKENEELVMNHLDYREKDGYDKVSVMFYPKASDDGASTVAPFELFIYVGSEQNKFFAGPADVNSIAKQVVSAVGPSGTNSEYVLQLALAMRKLAPGIVDDHLFSLEEAVKHLQNEKGEPNVNS
ncbi:Gamma-glutamylcyclotransferase [Gryllus bimaculatus]|nr:Gamma-glutamylcyclotransferase [Gryllus bimaculatus]